MTAVVVGPAADGTGALALITIADVDDRERALRGSPAAARLPVAGSAEGRQLRRWIAHSLAARALVDLEVDQPGEELAVDGVSGALGAGSVALAVLTGSPAARRFAARLTADVRLSPAALTRLALGHPEAVSRTARHVVDGLPVNGGRPVRVRAADLPASVASALTGAPAGSVVTGVDVAGRRHELTVLDEAGASTEHPWDGTGTLAAARARAFGRWLDGRRAALVHPRHGFEHPADPGQPDNTHRH